MTSEELNSSEPNRIVFFIVFFLFNI